MSESGTLSVKQEALFHKAKDMNSAKIIDLAEITPREPVPGAKARFIHSSNMTFAYWEFKAGTDLPLHDHLHEQVVNLTSGEFVLTVDGNPIKLTPGRVVMIPGGVPHSGKAITECRIIDVFHPVREDLRE